MTVQIIHIKTSNPLKNNLGLRFHFTLEPQPTFVKDFPTSHIFYFQKISQQPLGFLFQIQQTYEVGKVTNAGGESRGDRTLASWVPDGPS